MTRTAFQSCLALIAVLACSLLGSAHVTAQQPLTPPANLEVIGELRPSSPNIPLLLVVQWDDLDGADKYELERADAPAAGAGRVYELVATLTAADRRPNGKIGYVDEAGFANAGGDCFRVRALRGAEASDWSERCLPVPPTDEPGSPNPNELDFTVEFTRDYEFTIITWRTRAGAYGPFTLSSRNTFVPLAVVPVVGGPATVRLVFPRLNGCFRLDAPGITRIERPCQPFPTDLGGLSLPGRVDPIDLPVVVRRTGRNEAPIAVAWRANGGPTDLMFRIDRKIDAGYFEAVSLSYAGAQLPDDDSRSLVFLDPGPLGGDEQCYRVTAVSSLGETLVGQACLGDALLPPNAGSGSAANRESPTSWTRLAVVLLVAAVIAAGGGASPGRRSA